MTLKKQTTFVTKTILKERLRAYAQKNKLSMSYCVELAVYDYVNENNNNN